MTRRLLLLGVICLGLVTPLTASVTAAVNPPSIPMASYIARLEGMRTLLRQTRVAEAQQLARQLKGTRIDTRSGSFTADPSLLDTVIANRVGAEGRLTVEVAELRKSVPGAVAPGNRKLLDRLRREEAASKIKAGGEVAQPPVSTEPLIERIVEAAGKALEWLGDELVKFWDWLTQMWPRDKATGGSAINTRLVVGALAMAIVTVVGILVWEVMRRSRRNIQVPAAANEPIASSQDADPLSRGASEWERYAAQLAAAGRIREAIRAWYHAVLVTCYGAGILHYRKGRTNWEYVGAISPEMSWRSDFITLTRAFETEWYGHTTSTRDALESCSERAERILIGLRRGAAA